jgi:glucosamine--fructose-6-phosphate aminotransferase (isomerizing)
LHSLTALYWQHEFHLTCDVPVNNSFSTEIRQQPTALRDLIAFYQSSGNELLSRLPQPGHVLLTGMGASYHAALYGSYALQAVGIPAVALEATNLLNFSGSLLKDTSSVIFISQSGSSGEVGPLLHALPKDASLIALTNQPDSPLARGAHLTLPLLAGQETTVANKTYVNTLAWLWLLARHWGGQPHDFTALNQVADEIDAILNNAETVTQTWLKLWEGTKHLYFLGHGPHESTARQAAMMLSEWAKQPAFAAGIGAFRHGPIEAASADMSAIIFGAGGKTGASAWALADELRRYEARVLLVSGHTVIGAQASPKVDDLLSPMLDVIPAQLFAEALARHLNVPPGFRHISKVVTRL